MTTGGVSLDAFSPHPPSGSWTGTKGFRNWVGADEPRSPKVAATFWKIQRVVTHPQTGVKTVKTYKIREWTGYPPKRARKGEHAYSKQYQRLSQNVYPFPWYASPEFLWAGLGSWGAATLLDANDQIKLVNKLIEKLKGSDFNMSVFLGEGHQTLKLLTDTAIRIAKAGYHVKKLDVYGAARALFEGTTRRPLARHDWWAKNANLPAYVAKNSSSLWLELQYGWLPLLNDAEACAQSLSHHLNVPFAKAYRVSVRRETKATINKRPDGVNDVTTSKYRIHRRSLIARISEKPTGWSTLGLLDPELVAWELVPFSFVADWFIPIGSWLEARAWASRLTGTFITSDKKLGFAGPVHFNGVKCNSNMYWDLLFDRVISTNLAVPMPQVKPFGKIASWQHCANAIALVVQTFSGSKVRY